MSANAPELPPNAGPVARSFFQRPWFYAALLGVAAITLMRMCYAESRAKPLPRLAQLPAFSLTEQSGAAFGTDELRGQVWVASFFFSTCTTLCPRLMRANADLQSRLEDAGLDVKLVSITVDPEVDTPEALTAYARTYRADPARWHFLTGERDTIYGLVVRGFQTAMGDKIEDANGVVDVTHSGKLILVDQQGWVRWYFGNDTESRNAIVNHARNLLEAPDAAPATTEPRS